MGDDTLVKLGDRPAFIKAFPFLKVAPPRIQKRCKCNRSAEAKKYYKKVANGLKHTLLAMSAAQKDTLRELLRAQSVVIYIKGARGVEKHVI